MLEQDERKAGPHHDGAGETADVDAVEDVDQHDVGHDAEQQRSAQQRRPVEGQEQAAQDLEHRNEVAVDGRVSEVVPGQPEARHLAHRRVEPGLEDGELRAHELGEAVADERDRDEPATGSVELNHHRRDPPIPPVDPGTRGCSAVTV